VEQVAQTRTGEMSLQLFHLSVYLQSGVCASGFTTNEHSWQKFFLVLLGASRGFSNDFLQIASPSIPVHNQPVSWKLFLNNKETVWYSHCCAVLQTMLCSEFT